MRDKRTTLALDEDLLARAKRALGCTTMRATVEKALRHVTAEMEHVLDERATRQREYLDRLSQQIDVDVMDRALCTSTVTTRASRRCDPYIVRRLA